MPDGRDGSWEREEPNRWQPFETVAAAAPDDLIRAAARAGVPHEVRRHEPARHARHLASIWDVPLPDAGRATLFYAGHPTPVLVVVPADRKVGAPRLRDFLGAGELRVLRADRGVGRVGWRGLAGALGALPAVPGMFAARLLLDSLVLQHGRVLLALDAGRSWAIAPADFLRLGLGEEVEVVGRTRLLPGGGMVRDPLP